MNFLNMIKNNFIDRENIIIYYFKLFQLSENELLFIIKIFRSINDDKFSFNDAIKSCNLTKVQTDKIIASLIEKNIVTTKKSKKDGLYFSFASLWKQISFFIEKPDIYSNVEDKINWIIEILEFERNNLTLTTIEDFVKNYDWNIIMEMVLLLRNNNMQNISWDTFVKIIEENNQKTNITEIKKILKENWLEH